MKKKFWLIVAALATTLCLCFGIVACGEEPSDGPADDPQIEQNGSTPEPGNGNGGNGEQNPEEHKHSYMVDNVCSICGDKWEYTERLKYAFDETNTCSVAGGIGTVRGDIVLPYGYEGKYVTSIGDEAFAGCSGLTGITIPDIVTSIGEGAFKDCSGLTSITIPDSVKSIGGSAFAGCSNLTRVIWNAESCTKAGASSSPIFEGCTKLSTVTIGENVKTIPDYAFYDCDGLTSIVIPDSVTSIGEGAFS